MVTPLFSVISGIMIRPYESWSTRGSDWRYTHRRGRSDPTRPRSVPAVPAGLPPSW
jgi:hypothetical protein